MRLHTQNAITERTTVPPETALRPEVKRWGVARTKARAEKVLGGYLAARGVPFFLPLITKQRLYGRHKRESSLPLFPGYLFFDLDAMERRQVFASRKVAQILVTVHSFPVFLKTAG